MPANYNSHSLIFLDKYTKYKIQILAFNPAGDGPRSDPVYVRTHQVCNSAEKMKVDEGETSSTAVSWSQRGFQFVRAKLREPVLV